VSLRAAADEVQLQVIDKGVGFDLEDAKHEKGLGLVSMQERVHLAHGVLAIESEVHRGTKISVRVPFVEETQKTS